MDRYFTSVSLAAWALENKFTIAGTMRHDRKEILKEVKVLNDREEMSVLHVYHEEKKIMLVSYIDKKKSGKKNVIILSTMHENVRVKDQRKKPQVHAMYDHTKGRVDVVDLLSTSHSTRIQTKRWPLNALAFILDTCRSNAKTILAYSGIQFTNFKFTYNLGKALILPSIKRRYCNSNGLQIRIINKIRRVLGVKEVSRKPDVENAQTKSGRSLNAWKEFLVPAHTRPSEMNNKLKFKCRKCNKFICKKHQH